MTGIDTERPALRAPDAVAALTCIFAEGHKFFTRFVHADAALPLAALCQRPRPVSPLISGRIMFAKCIARCASPLACLCCSGASGSARGCLTWRRSTCRPYLCVRYLLPSVDLSIRGPPPPRPAAWLPWLAAWLGAWLGACRERVDAVHGLLAGPTPRNYSVNHSRGQLFVCSQCDRARDELGEFLRQKAGRGGAADPRGGGTAQTSEMCTAVSRQTATLSK